MSDDVLPMWTETFSPSDFPGKHVVRRWNITGEGGWPTDEVLVFDTRDDLIDEMGRGLVFLARNEGDDPVIVGSWI